MPALTFPVHTAADASRRVAEAAAFVAAHAAGGVTIVAATREAADELARRVAVANTATVGIHRFSLSQLAARLAAPRLAARGTALGTLLGFEALAARAVFESADDPRVAALGPAVRTPGFPRAVARTTAELRAWGVPSEAVGAAPGVVNAGVAVLSRRVERELAASGAEDHEGLMHAAAQAVANEPWLRAPLVLLDVAVDSVAEEALLRALVLHASDVVATCHPSDEAPIGVLRALGGMVQRVPDSGDRDVDRLRAQLFSPAVAASAHTDGTVVWFSAPGEARESVEVVRYVLQEAARGVAFDEMAIVVRAPARYQGVLEHALARAGVPAWFERGTRRPHPTGRAFLALLACADEGLSARRFAEYLSLGQVPSAGGRGAGGGARDSAATDAPDAEATAGEPDDGLGDLDPASSGSVPAPRRWEQMLVEAAVRRGDPDRWRRRLEGLAAELRAREAEAMREDPDSPRAQALARDRDRLAQLGAFAVPLVEEMAAWPPSATWGDWLTRFEALVPRVVRMPGPVLTVLHDLRPMSRVGPVTLREARHVLTDRLRQVEADPPARRYGRVCVSAPSELRGRSFRVGFVVGLTERVFPDRVRQDPLLPDEARGHLSPHLPTQATRSARERRLLHVAIGACRERVYVSYSRLDVSEARARVPSFYALDVVRGVTGRLPRHQELSQAAGRAGHASLAWPAPKEPADAIDSQEHDLAVLRSLLDQSDPAAARGRAQYLLRVSPTLRRAVVERWARASTTWSQFDGVMRVTDRTREALAQHRLTARAYSVSALQRFAACPYQFLLSAIYRLHQPDSVEPLQTLDPLTRGSLVHRVQALTLRALGDEGQLPLTPGRLNGALRVMDGALARAADEFRERLAPAIPRVWSDEVASIGRDLRGWMRRMALEDGAWVARYVELGFGLPPSEERDATSWPEAVLVDGRFPLRGAIDLVEVQRETGAVRVTDHKTGKDRTTDALIIGGGAVLQPVLYAAVVEQALQQPVAETRLSFCTVAGGYQTRSVPLTPHARRLGVEALEVVDRAVETGLLLPAPVDGACRWCDFRSVCGPTAAERAARKSGAPLRDLLELRGRP